MDQHMPELPLLDRLKIVAEFLVPATQSTCPALGGEGFSTLYVSSAAAGVRSDASDSTAPRAP